MPEKFVTRGFVGRREPAGTQTKRTPPGQHLVKDFPVLSAGPTPRTDLAKWTFRIEGLVKEPVSWGWNELQTRPALFLVTDICRAGNGAEPESWCRALVYALLLRQVE